MSVVITAFLFFALCAYVVAGGADFGVGVVELFSGRDRDEVTSVGEKAIAPIWEANHIWLIIVIVVLFIAFPEIHVALTTRWHIPLVLMLIGIVARGTAFTFRYYDIGDDPGLAVLWSRVFRISSLMVPITFGAIIGSLFIPTTGETVWSLYFEHWLAPFPLSVGVFVVTLFAWIAVQFLTDEVPEADRQPWVVRGRRYTVALVVVGCAVFALGGLAGQRPPFKPVVFGSVVVASAGVAALWFRALNWNFMLVRGITFIVVVSIITGYFGAYFPRAIVVENYDLVWIPSAPDATIDALGYSLLAGSVLIIPGLAYLYYVFRQNDSP